MSPRSRNQKTAINSSAIARNCGRSTDVVRRILREDPEIRADKPTQDLVFSTARKIGYDFQKLKMSKRLDLRIQTLDEIARKIGENPGWNRREILGFLQDARDLAHRVQVRLYGKDR